MKILIPEILISLSVVLALHIASVIVNKKVSLIINIVNIVLHILLFVLLIIKQVPTDEAVLVYMASVFVYTLSYLIVEKTRGEGGEK